MDRESGRDSRPHLSDPQLEGSNEPELVEVLVSGPGIGGVSSVDLSCDDEQLNQYRPQSSDELEVFDVPTLGDREVEFGR